MDIWHCLSVSKSKHPTMHSNNNYIASFIPQVPEHALFQEHTTAMVTEVLLQLDRICGTACHLTCNIQTLATMTFKHRLKMFLFE